MKPKFIYSDKFLNYVSWFFRVGGISLFPFVVLREKYKNPVNNYTYIRAETIHNHETIHFKQQAETLIILFYIIYILEFTVKLAIYRNVKQAYKNISFEREAYFNEGNFTYINHRKKYNWINLIFIK